MSIWKENTATKPAPMSEAKEPPRAEPPPRPEPARVAPAAPLTTPTVSRKESLIAADLTIEGKIEGGGSVRIAGKFKGDVNVQGDLIIEQSARLTGSVRADKVTIAGQLEGNVERAALVDLQQSGVVIGDLKAGCLTVAAGARLRGQADFGWDDKESKVGKHGGNGSAGTGSFS